MLSLLEDVLLFNAFIVGLGQILFVLASLLGAFALLSQHLFEVVHIEVVSAYIRFFIVFRDGDLAVNVDFFIVLQDQVFQEHYFGFTFFGALHITGELAIHGRFFFIRLYINNDAC